jgi:hypothetical protein
MNKDVFKEILQTFLITILGAAIIYLLLANPISFKLGLAFRYDFSSIVLLITLILVICFQIPGVFSKILLISFTAAIFTIPVTGLWNSGQSEQYILGGIIPFSDARYYYMDSRRLLEGALYSSGAARRPLFTALLSSILWLSTQNLYITIGILVFIVALAVYSAVLEIRIGEGFITASVFFVLLFLYSRFLLGKTLSEMAGLPLGLLSFVFLYRGAKIKDLKCILVGLFLMSLAQNARPGALLILPALLCWAGWFFRDAKQFNLKVFAIACVFVALGFAVNFILFNTLASSESAAFGNFSYTLYGLARGGLGWTQIFTDHPETWTMAANVQADYIYSLAFDIIRNKPMNLVNGILSSYQTFFSLDDYYGSLCWLGGEGLVGNIARSGLYMLILAGLYSSIRNFKIPTRSLFVLAFIGICLSVPFAPPLDSNRMRVYAATIPFFIVLPSIGLWFLIGKLPVNKLPLKIPSNQDIPSPSMLPASFLAIVLVIGMTIIPLGLRLTMTKNVLSADKCSPGLTRISFRVLPGNNLQIIDQGSSNHDWVPQLRKNNFGTLVHNLPNWETFPLFTGVKSGQIILADLELTQMKEMVLIADWDKLDHSSNIQTACATSAEDPLLRDYRVYFAKEYSANQ